MSDNPFASAALILVGHGSTKCEDSSAPVYQHAAELRRRGIFAEVREAFWKIEPKIPATMGQLKANDAIVAPLFISEGYFTEEAIPAALGLRKEGDAGFDRTQRIGDRIIRYCRAVGTHPAMTDVILSRAHGVVRQFPFPRVPQPEEITLIIAGHGTSKNENSRLAVDSQVQTICRRQVFGDVRGAFMLEAPEIRDCYDSAPTKNVVVVPFFISDGQHVSEDIPILLGEPERVVHERLARGMPVWRNPTERSGKRVWCSASVGTDPILADVILERVREAVDYKSRNG